tara:strand:- start:531 stop:674 length:144 start_codon:yes stop_codon:yes gene_type:complete
MLSLKEQIEEIADKFELKFELEILYPFEEKINKIFKQIEDNVNNYKT